mgnify:CR=1 FL=1|jgi:hypothetical protein
MSLKPTLAINKNVSTFDYAESTYLDEVVFDFKQFGKDDAELMEKSPIIFCLKQCYKIGFFLQKVHGIELSRMDIEFTVDDYGEIFFQYADNIYCRYE